ncbi:MAG: DNA polymerase III subunit chi [Candidatus Kinetoplastibacterium crithidii]|nr:MAG: DNA polymerase III subunit chi [Candidatus Kinetoplastibacterium crithidii]
MQIDFVFDINNKLLSTCHIIKEIYMTSSIIVFCEDKETAHTIDKLLWSFDDISFIPHCISDNCNKNNTKLIITTKDLFELKCIDKTNKNYLSYIVNLSNNYPQHYDQFDHLIEIVSKDEDDRAKARLKWKFYKKNGHIVKGKPFKIPT